jgi:hypothetical protein
VLNAFTLQSSAWINSGNGKFVNQQLPNEAQLFPVYALNIDDYDGDGTKDIVLGGNLYKAKPETGIYAAGYGLLLLGDGTGKFSTMSPQKSGLSVKGEIRGLRQIKRRSTPSLLVAKNNDKMEILTIAK